MLKRNQASISRLVIDSLEQQHSSSSETLPDILRSVREHLGMDVAFISEFCDGRRVFRYVDSHHPDQPVIVDASDALEDSYCQRVIDGRLPQLITDAQLLAEARKLPVTAELPIGAHLSIPIVLADGRIYGTFCCFSFSADPTLNERDLALMRVFADLVARQIDRDLAAEREKFECETRIKSVLAGVGLKMVYQPIVDLVNGAVAGFEALSRFHAEPQRGPDIWFAEAARIGLGVPLEAKAASLALHALRLMPGGPYLALNFSAETILSSALESLLEGFPLDRVVLEITEHESIEHYAELAEKLQPLRDAGLRISADDVGAGYANFRHILNLAPDMIKLDLTLTRNIDSDSSRRALASALIAFAEKTGCAIVAEGIETEAELDTLRGLGVRIAQGYLLGKPMPLAEAVRLQAHLNADAAAEHRYF